MENAHLLTTRIKNRFGFVFCIHLLMAILFLGCEKPALAPVDNLSGVKLNLFAKVGSVSQPQQGTVDSVRITNASFVLGSVKLEGAGVDSTLDYASLHTQIVDLDLRQAPVAVDTFAIPPGVYKEVELSIDKLEPGNPDEEPLINARPEFSNASVLIQGIVYIKGIGEPFTFTTDIDRDMEIELTPLLTVPTFEVGAPAIGTKISIVVDTSLWFVDDAGVWLDPRDEANKSAIENGVQASLEAFEDDDENGVVD